MLREMSSTAAEAVIRLFDYIIRKDNIMRKYTGCICIFTVIMLSAAGCGGNAGKGDKEPIVKDFDTLMRDDPAQVIVRDEPQTISTERTEQETEKKDILAQAKFWHGKRRPAKRMENI